MNQEADRLNKMVNDILDFSRLESPNVDLEKIFADIGPIIELTIKIDEGSCRRKSYQILDYY